MFFPLHGFAPDAQSISHSKQYYTDQTLSLILRGPVTKILEGIFFWMI